MGVPEKRRTCTGLHWPGGGEGGQLLARAHPQHPVQPLDLSGFLLRQKEREAVRGPHAGHSLIHRCHGRALDQSVILIGVQPLGHQREVEGFQQDLGRGWHQRGPQVPEADSLAPLQPTHLERLPAEERGQEAGAT